MAPENSREQALEDQVVLLNQQLEALKGSDQQLGVIMALGRGMTHRLAMILLILVKRAPAVITRTSLHTLFYGDRSDGGPEPKIFDVHISRLRKVLKRLEAPGGIDTVWNAGYRANPKLVNWIQDKYKQQINPEEI